MLPLTLNLLGLYAVRVGKSVDEVMEDALLVHTFGIPNDKVNNDKVESDIEEKRDWVD